MSDWSMILANAWSLMFTFFFLYSDDHSQSVVSAMQTIMVVIIEESEEIQENLLLTILSALGRKKHVRFFPPFV
jgi:hypothetical protein